MNMYTPVSRSSEIILYKDKVVSVFLLQFSQVALGWYNMRIVNMFVCTSVWKCHPLFMRVFFFFCLFYLKYLLAADLDAAVASLGLLLRKFLPQDLQLLHKVSLVFGHSQALCLFRQLGWGQRLLRGPRTTLVLHLLTWMTGGITCLKGEMEDKQSRTDGEGSTRYEWEDKGQERRVEGKRVMSVWFTIHLKQQFKQQFFHFHLVFYSC